MYHQLFSAMLVLSSCLLYQDVASYHQMPCVRVAKKPLKPVLKGPDPRNLESLFRPRYSNQAARRAPC